MTRDHQGCVLTNEMNKNRETIEQMLSQNSIYPPGSDETLLNEKSLCRHFEKEYKRYLEQPVSLDSLDISSTTGPIMGDTDNLMEQHYDESIELFQTFLDERYMAYTMAYYGERGEIDRSLEEAQSQKFKLIAERLALRGDERILNVGCGFGSMETYLLEYYPGLRITGITPSKVQVKFLKQKIADDSHPLHRGFDIIEGAIDDLDNERIGIARFDVVISIGVFEHVHNIRAFFEKAAALLKPGGKMFHHLITSDVVIPQLLKPEETMIGKYFPGGRIWPRDELRRHSEKFTLVDEWFINGNNYWHTLDDWHRRFWRRTPELYDSGMSLDEIKHWNDYFSLCKAMFRPLSGSFYGNSQYLFELKDQ